MSNAKRIQKLNNSLRIQRHVLKNLTASPIIHDNDETIALTNRIIANFEAQLQLVTITSQSDR